jgi:phenylacetyl-CoA:acceptor oxidoreductase subunit 2
VIDRISLPLHFVGHVLAGLLLLGGNPALTALAGVAALAGGAYWKFSLVVRAGYQQGFALPKLPQRGSGRFAAPARLSGR